MLTMTKFNFLKLTIMSLAFLFQAIAMCYAEQRVEVSAWFEEWSENLDPTVIFYSLENRKINKHVTENTKIPLENIPFANLKDENEISYGYNIVSHYSRHHEHGQRGNCEAKIRLYKDGKPLTAIELDFKARSDAHFESGKGPWFNCSINTKYE